MSRTHAYALDALPVEDQRKPRFGFNTLGNVIHRPENQKGRNVTIIAAMDRKFGIGRANGIPWHVPPDMEHFKRLTMGHPTIMGRKTFESLGCKPLPGRLNVVLTSSEELAAKFGDVENVKFLSGTVEEAISYVCCKKRDEDFVSNDDVTRLPELPVQIFIIGGGEIYSQAMRDDLVDDMILTTFDKEAVGCDTFFPSIFLPMWLPPEFSTHQYINLKFKYEYWRRYKNE